jgi:pSer/pThr/pTyr-binding forkhead associated (FHA) protein
MSNDLTDAVAFDYDDDPTVELEVRAATVPHETEPDPEMDSNVVAGSFGPAASDEALREAMETIRSVKSEMLSREEAIGALRVELEQLRGFSSGLEEEVALSEKVINILGQELKSAQKKQRETEGLLEAWSSELASVKSQLSSNASAEQECTRENEEADTVDEPGLADAASEKAKIEAPDQNESGKQVIEKSGEPTDSSGSREEKPAKTTSREEIESEPQPSRMIVACDDNGSVKYSIGDGSLRLGSGPDNDIRIDSKYISHNHAEIVSGPNECVVKDKGSANGTYVNSKRIKRYALRNGDRIFIGKHRFEYIEELIDSSDTQSSARDAWAGN